MSRSITVLGATGSVGLATLDLVGAAPEGAYRVTALTAHSRAAELAALALRFRPQFTALADSSQATLLEAALAGSGLKWGAGAEAVAEAASMPGVLMIEALAQTGALLMSKTLNADIANTLILFIGVDRARFRRPVRPGDVLEMPVKVVAQRRGLFRFEGVALVNGVKVADADFSATSADRQNTGEVS